MAKAFRLTFAEIREIFHIVQEAIDHGEDPVVWRRMMLFRIARLIDAKWGVAFLMPLQFDPYNLQPPIFVYSPMPADVQRSYAKVFRAANVGDDPITAVVARLAHKPVTLTRRQMVDDQAWYSSGAYKRWRHPMGVDDIIHSHDPLKQFGVMSVLGFTRERGARPFTNREARIVDLVRAELKHRWERMAAERADHHPLTARQRQLLTHLRGTMTEKQIARYMGLSPHTVHNYVQAMYRKLNVSGRAELTAQQDRLAQRSILPRIGYGGH